MKRQGVLEILTYFVVGILFFLGYYLLMTEVFDIYPFSGVALIPTIYFVVAIFAFPKAGDIISNKTKDSILPPNFVMPFAYIIAPFFLFSKR